MKADILRKVLWGYIAVVVLWSCYVYGIIVKANGDNVEHLHSSWLIWQGYQPYKDFFQHHNPLLWYLSAPFVALMIDHIEIGERSVIDGQREAGAGILVGNLEVDQLFRTYFLSTVAGDRAQNLIDAVLLAQ